MISFIVAMDKNRVIGNKNQLPWNLPADLQYVKKVTTGHTIVMGRKNYESIGRPLPNRENIILTRNKNYKAEGCTVLHSVDDVLELANYKDIFIFGGEEIYKLFMPYADFLYLTMIWDEFEGDTYFPQLEGGWEIESFAKGIQDEKNKYKHSFYTYRRLRV